MGIDPRRPLIVAGSTAEGEEAMLHTACPPGAQLLCAPRKPDRFDQAAHDLPGCVRRSWSRPGGGQPLAPQGLGTTRQRFLLDTIGELRAAYELADVCVVGRSFGTLFGSDPIEPVSLGKATVIGPAHSDFQTIVAALKAAGAIELVTPGDLRRVLQALLDDPARRARLATRGRACIAQHQGATRRHADLLLGLAKPPPGE
jgi:3-deoxy-D-manno-octulosonic-acid transferase